MAKKWMKRYVLCTIWTGNAIKMGEMTRSQKKESLFGEALFLTTSHLVVLLI